MTTTRPIKKTKYPEVLNEVNPSNFNALGEKEIPAFTDMKIGLTLEWRNGRSWRGKHTWRGLF